MVGIVSGADCHQINFRCGRLLGNLIYQGLVVGFHGGNISRACAVGCTRIEEHCLGGGLLNSFDGGKGSVYNTACGGDVATVAPACTAVLHVAVAEEFLPLAILDE